MWESGQKLVCIKKGPWINLLENKPADLPTPKYNEIVKLDGYNPKTNGFIYLKEYDYTTESGFRISFDVKYFRLLDYSSNINMEVIAKFEPIEERSDLIIEPQKEKA